MVAQDNGESIGDDVLWLCVDGVTDLSHCVVCMLSDMQERLRGIKRGREGGDVKWPLHDVQRGDGVLCSNTWGVQAYALAS